MIGRLRTCVRKRPIIVVYFEFETVLNFYNLEARNQYNQVPYLTQDIVWESEKIQENITYSRAKKSVSHVIFFLSVIFKGCILCFVFNSFYNVLKVFDFLKLKMMNG